MSREFLSGSKRVLEAGCRKKRMPWHKRLEPHTGKLSYTVRRGRRGASPLTYGAVDNRMSIELPLRLSKQKQRAGGDNDS